MRRPALNLLLRTPPTDATPDGELLAEYVSRRDPVAFERLVRRHAGTVWHVCRRVAGNPHDAEDAFQATFLVLVRSAGSVVRTGSLGEWLYGVAFRTASKARVSAARRARREATAARPEGIDPPPEPNSDFTAAVHAELATLPDRYRLPILLCDLEGLTRTDAAARLGWKEGTLSGRLNRARKRLAEKLSARGITLPGGVLAAGVASGPATAAVEMVLGWARTETPVVTQVVALANGVKRDMTLKLLSRITILSVAVLSALGVGLYGLLPEPQSAAAPVPKVETVKPEDITADRLDLLENRRTQREIKMTAEQRAKLLDGLDALRDDLGAKYEASERAPGPGVPPPSRNFDEIQKEFYASRREFAATVVTPKQFARLLEMEVQLMGEFAPMNPRVAEKMKLSEKQKGRVIEVLRENEDFTAYTQQVPVPTPNDGPRKVYKTPAQMREAVEKELTAAQRKVWDELAGEKLSFDADKNQSDFSVRSKYRVLLRPEGYTTPGKGGGGR